MHKTVPTVIVVVLLSKHKKSYDKCLSRIVRYPVSLVKKNSATRSGMSQMNCRLRSQTEPQFMEESIRQHAQNYFMTFLSDYLFSLKSSLIAMFTREVPSKSYE